MTVAVDDVVRVKAPHVDPRQEFRVIDIRPAKRSRGRTVPAQFDAVGAARDKNGRLHDAARRSFYLTDIRASGGGDDMPTATKKSTAKRAPAKKATTKAKAATAPTRGRNAARDAEIVKLSKAGKSKAELAEKFGISTNAVHGVLWRAK